MWASDPKQSYVNPRRQCIILGARELDVHTFLTTDTHLPFSVNINLKRGIGDDAPKISFPVVQGMGFVTARYLNASPMIQTAGLGFKQVSSPISIKKAVKYRIKDMDDASWILYIVPGIGTLYTANHATRMTRLNAHTIILPNNFTGTLQLAKNPRGTEGEALYDKCFNTFATAATLTGTVTEARGTYSFLYTKIGISPLLMFLLPHHLQSLDPDLKPSLTKLQLRTTTKGAATAITIADRLTFIEPNLPTTLAFGPWTSQLGNTRIRYVPEMLAFLAGVAERDLRRAMSEHISQVPTLPAGKSLAKFATIVWVIKDVLQNNALAATGLDQLKSAVSRFVQNRQRHALYYDDAWKGLVSNAGFTNGPFADNSNTYYSDHHVHYAYFVYTAAVIAYLDSAWPDQDGGENRAWTNMLVKDFAESDYGSRDYPFMRCFDWWHGHSWGRGLFEAESGKEMASTGEDGFASFAVRMWGKCSGDTNMEKRGRSFRAIPRRSRRLLPMSTLT
jgi:endo-1,3(4)-beta-glucanase